MFLNMFDEPVGELFGGSASATENRRVVGTGDLHVSTLLKFCLYIFKFTHIYIYMYIDYNVYIQ